MNDLKAAFDAEREEWYALHSRCPKCGGSNVSSKLAGRIQLRLGDYRDTNPAKCHSPKCHWHGHVYDMIPTADALRAAIKRHTYGVWMKSEDIVYDAEKEPERKKFLDWFEGEVRAGLKEFNVTLDFNKCAENKMTLEDVYRELNNFNAAPKTPIEGI